MNNHPQPKACSDSSFFLPPSAFSPTAAAELVRASAAAYLPSLPSFVSPEIVNDSTGTRVVITKIATGLIVAFRGTQDLRNWLTDLDCRRISLNGVKIHEGFEVAVNSVLDRIRETICGFHKRIWLTGHSLGGALAMLCAYRLQHDCDISGVYTFGQPRVGNAAFRGAYNETLKSRTFRVIHSDDIIPRVPWLLGMYRHAGHEAFFPRQRQKEEGRRKSQLSSLPVLDCPFFRKLPSDIAGMLDEAFVGRMALLNDHHVSTYQALFGTVNAAPQGAVLSSFFLPPSAFSS
ncbi:MAG TPA: lipase family protein [Candidatus Saccharimonadales bacterium]|nr:lipase family protein [Candidatus Saccharimonadales bacterium]